MFNIRIRGIYSTALTHLLLDNAFTIVQPSIQIRERFNLPNDAEKNAPPDIDVFDRLDRQGVSAIGTEETVARFASHLQSTLADVVIRRQLSLFPQIIYPSSERDLGIAPRDVLAETEALGSSRKVRLDIEFPGSSKRTLDYFRGLVTPTLEGHHYYKACGGKVSSLLDMAEKMLEKGSPPREVERLFKETIERELPDEGSQVGLEHVKIDGKTFHLGEAEITRLDRENDLVRLIRTFDTEGIYDGLKSRKDPGDRAVTDIKIGGWSFRTRYFSKEGAYKGTYVNVNTPIEMYPTEVRYVDLEVDICLWPDGKIREIDREKLGLRISQGYVSERLGQIVKKKVEDIINSLSLDAEKELDA